MAQLADWITKLEPHFVQVWLNQAWNMAYNISVKFKDFPDRWRWVQRGISLLRDDGLRFNPNEVLIYRELAWFFQHKIGQNLDDANMYYKSEWSKEMAQVFGKLRKPDINELINPQTDDARTRYQLLTNKFKMDPVRMKKVDETYGPLEWRLPEAHAIYWAVLGLEKAKENPTKVNAEDLIQLRRVIYQSMHLSVQRGRLLENRLEQAFEFGPNLEIIPKTNFAYEQAMEEDVKNRDHISRAHRNFLTEAVYFLYLNNRVADAAKWYQYLGTNYPDKNVIENNFNSRPSQVTLHEFVMATMKIDMSETDQKKIQSVIEGLVTRAFENMAFLDEDDQAAGLRMLARQVRSTYMSKVPERAMAIGVPTVDDTEKEIRRRLLDPEKGMPLEARAVLRTKLGLPAESAPVPPSTNAPPSIKTNTPPTASTNAPAAKP